MKCRIPEISWHNREPVLSIDIQPIENDFYRLATGGSDYHVLIWQCKIIDNGAVSLDVISDLTRHQRAVNVVRWSPNGQYLASADDDANIIIWNLKTDNIPLLEDDNNDKEIWVITKIMRGHKEDIYDLCWSPNSLKLLSGSIDNTAIIWDFNHGKMENILTDHKGFVQGVTWDPKGEYLATLSSDRICRIFEGNGKHVRARIGKGALPLPESHPLSQKEVKYFHDDTFKSYFRRITFTPDGNLIIAPAGCVETEDTKKALCGTYLFTLDHLAQPIAILPLQKQCSIAVRCCPILYELRPDGPDPIVNLPYRMIIAVASESDLILYDTQQPTPIAHLQKIHYTRLTDLAWSADGRLLMASSTDGFCTVLTFDLDELGIRYTKEESEVEESFLNVSGCEELEKSNIVLQEGKNKDEKVKKESFLVQWANKVKEDGNVKPTDEVKTEESKENLNQNENKSNEDETKSTEQKQVHVIEIDDSPVKNTNDIKRVTPRRIIPIKLNSLSGKEKRKVSTTPGKRKVKTDNNQVKESKANSLMNFLKVTTPDKPKTTDVNIIISEESSNARDAWVSSEAARTSSKKRTIDEDDEMAETIPDFKLQIEESASQKSKEKCNESILLENSTDVEEIKDNIGGKTSNALNQHNTQCNDVPDQSAIKQTEIAKTIEDSVKKTPRRIQLITLSSPKHKKQKTNT